MAEDTTPAPAGGDKDGEDVQMLEPKTLSLRDAVQQAPSRTWEGTEIAIIGHVGACEICSQMGLHALDCIKNGELPAMMEASRKMHSGLADRGLLPIKSMVLWMAAAVASGLNADMFLPVSALSLITYYVNMLPAAIDFIERSVRPGVRTPGTNAGDLAKAATRVATMVSLLKELLTAQARVSQLALSGGYARLSALTTPAIWSLIPRRIRGDRTPIYPTIRVVTTPHGDVACALPSRPLSLFELDDGTIVMPLSAAGHLHLPGSNWVYVNYAAGSKTAIFDDGWDTPFTSSLDRWRLYLEAKAFPHHQLSVMQQAFTVREGAALELECGAEVFADVLSEAGVVNMGERFRHFGLVVDAPLSVPGTLEGNEWRWNATAIATWTFIDYCFPTRGDKVLRTLQRNRNTPISASRDIPPFAPTVYADDVDPTAPQIIEHLVFACGLHRSEMRYVYTLAEKWGDVELGEEQAQLRSLLNQMHSRGETNTVAQRPLLFLPDDVPIGDLTPDIVIARFDKREARAKAATQHHPRPHNTNTPAKRPRVDGGP